VAQEYWPLTREQLNALAGEKLPERVAASFVGAGVSAPANLVAAVGGRRDGAAGDGGRRDA
jgi:hypothetical protein